MLVNGRYRLHKSGSRLPYDKVFRRRGRKDFGAIFGEDDRVRDEIVDDIGVSEPTMRMEHHTDLQNTF
jgi:hypothetical protein